MEWISQWQQLKLQNIVELSLSSNSPKWLQNRDGQLIFLELKLRGGWHTKDTCPIWLQIFSYDFFDSMSDTGSWHEKKRSNVQFRNGVVLAMATAKAAEHNGALTKFQSSKNNCRIFSSSNSEENNRRRTYPQSERRYCHTLYLTLDQHVKPEVWSSSWQGRKCFFSFLSQSWNREQLNGNGNGNGNSNGSRNGNSLHNIVELSLSSGSPKSIG
jgi:hypothetical protein